MVYVRGRFGELKIEYLNGVTHLPPVNMLIPMYVKSCDVHDLDLDLSHNKGRSFQIQHKNTHGKVLYLDLTNDKEWPMKIRIVPYLEKLFLGGTVCPFLR